MNLSVAINADQLILDEDKLKKLKLGLKTSQLDFRWVTNKYLQIHLLSLGDISDEKILSIKVNIAKLLEGHKSFKLKLHGISAYPNENEGRILWIGVQNSIALRSLQDALVQNLLESSRFREDKEFRPILPIVRLKNRKDVSDLISPYKNTDFGILEVSKLSLFNMVSGGAFPLYETIESFSLAKESSDKKVLRQMDV